MSNDTPEEGRFVTAPLQEKATDHPLTHFVIAAHLGIEEYTRDNEEECLRRAKAWFEMYERLGTALVFHRDGTPLKSRYISRGFIRRHEGRRPEGASSRTAEEFDKHLKLFEAGRTGIPSRSYRRTILTGASLRLEEPWAVFQEIDDHTDTEIRRVEEYPDGRLLWRIDDGGFGAGTADKEWVEAAGIPLLSVANARAFRRVDEVLPEQFEHEWETAKDAGCKWPTDLKAPREWMTLEQTTTVRCGDLKTTDDGSAFCAVHRTMAARVFPALFMGA